MSTNWNFADIYETVARAIPNAPCQIQGERVQTWQQFDRRANALAHDMLRAGLGRQSKIAAYLYNGIEYLECYYAAFKAALVPTNTNFRYGPDELAYLWENSDAEAVIFHATFAPIVDKLRGQLPKVKRWYVVADGAPMPQWAVDYEAVVAPGADVPALQWQRSGDDLLFLYTGGTTGMPKGVMWRQDDLFNVLGAGANLLKELPAITRLQELTERLRNAEPGSAPVFVPACPLMHGTGQFSSFIYMIQGGCIVLLDNRRFSSEELWATVERHHVTNMAIVGDAFARPMLEALDKDPGRYNLSSMRGISSSGVMWSQEVKQGLLRHMPHITLADSFGSSEAVGLGASASTADNSEQTARFMPGPLVKLFIEDTWAEAGVGERGLVAQTGFLPVGYYKDDEKTNKTFKVINGVRYSVPGDFAQLNADGSMMLLGRGSVCINTGGEKVFPEEVEEVLKRHPHIKDAVCVGVPDARFGQAICAVVEVRNAGTAVGVDDAAAHVKNHLAAYKAPRFTITVDTIGRAANGKVDYKGLTQLARTRLGI